MEDNLYETNNDSEEEVIELVIEEIKTDTNLNECIEKLNEITVLLKEIAQVTNKPVEVIKAPERVAYISRNSEDKKSLKDFKFTNPPTAEDFVTIKKIAIKENLDTTEVSTFLSNCDESRILKEFFSNIPDYEKLLQGEFDWELYDTVQEKYSGTGEYFALLEKAQEQIKQRCDPERFLRILHDTVETSSVASWSSVLCFFLDILPDSSRVFSSEAVFRPSYGNHFFLAKLHFYQQPTPLEYLGFWVVFMRAYLSYYDDNPTQCQIEFLFNGIEPNSDESHYRRMRRVLLDGPTSPPPARNKTYFPYY